MSPKALQSTAIFDDSDSSDQPNGFLIPPVQDPDSDIRRLVATNEEATIVIPEWINKSGYANAMRACFD